MIRVSVVIPAYRARATLPAALASVAAAGLPPEAVEVVIAPDDGDSYEALPDHGLSLTRCASHHIATGAGPARNRAVAAARGQFIAFLDADDTWGPGYLAALLPLAKASGAAFGQTRIMNAGAPVMTVPGLGRTQLEFADFGRTGASFHPVLRRDLAGPFARAPSQDVLHAMEALSCVGGSAPLGPALYELHLSGQSATAQSDFAARVGAAYEAHIRAIRSGLTRIAAEHRDAACAAFEAKAALNEAYARDGAGQSFYDYMRSRQGACPPPD